MNLDICLFVFKNFYILNTSINKQSKTIVILKIKFYFIFGLRELKKLQCDYRKK
jgi:hypothetical protein